MVFAVDCHRIRSGLTVFLAIVDETRLGAGDRAHRAELNRSYMGEIERATAIASLATAAKLAQALDLPLSSLISRCEESTPA